MPALLPVSELFPESFPESLPPGCAVFSSDCFVSSGCDTVDSSLESAIFSPALYAFPSLARTKHEIKCIFRKSLLRRRTYN